MTVDTHNHIQANLEMLRTELERLFTLFEEGFDHQTMVYEHWNAKDILGHLTYWHESFARNISDLGMGIKPTPLKGRLSEVNKQSVDSTQSESIETLIKRLKAAQNTIEAFIFDDTITLIPYKKGSRDYAPAQHLEVVSHHIHHHIKDIQETCGKAKEQN